MNIYSTYDIRIPSNEFNKAFIDTVDKYRAAVAFFINVRMSEVPMFAALKTQHDQLRKMELLTHMTKDNPSPKYSFGTDFYKFPS